jgi:hypothetical protein
LLAADFAPDDRVQTSAESVSQVFQLYCALLHFGRATLGVSRARSYRKVMRP